MDNQEHFSEISEQRKLEQYNGMLRTTKWLLRTIDAQINVLKSTKIEPNTPKQITNDGKKKGLVWVKQKLLKNEEQLNDRISDKLHPSIVHISAGEPLSDETIETVNKMVENVSKMSTEELKNN